MEWKNQIAPEWQTTFLQAGFRLERTEDQSWTLRWLGHPQTETMHNPRGAWSETCAIYGTAVEFWRNRFPQLSPLIWSVGLGLGYNEFICAQKLPGAAGLVSFETSEPLRKFFLEGILKEPVLEHPQTEHFLTEAFPGALQILQTWWRTGRLLLREDFTVDWQKVPSPHLILYDAFSSKSQSELWSEDFLVQWLSEKCEKKAVFVTYACTGALKRALKRTGFTREEFAGFGGKRESTLAWRDL